MNPTLWQQCYPYAQRLGLALGHSMWQVGLVALIVMILLRLLRGQSPGMRYSVALLGLLGMVVWPVMTFMRSAPATIRIEMKELRSTTGKEITAASEISDVRETSVAKETLSPPLVPISVPPSAKLTLRQWKLWVRPWFPRLAWTWIIGVSCLCAWRTLAWWRVGSWMNHHLAPVEFHWTDRFQTLARQYGLSRPVRLVASTKALVPFAAGILRPVALFPLELLSGLPAAHVEALMAHELAHLRRHDFAINLLQTIAETLLFFHPAVWWINRVIRQEREHCCDDLVITESSEREVNVRALAQVAEWEFTQRPFTLASNGGNVLARLQRLVYQRKPETALPGASAILLLLFGLTFAASLVRATATKITRGRILDRHGIVLAETRTDGVRHYPWGSLAAHALGYWNRLGKGTGFESTQRETLNKGEDVKLTLDVNLQWIVEDTLRRAGIGRGAVVLMDPQTGGVLAMASVPNFDPNTFAGSATKGIQGISAADHSKLSNDETMPLLNRCLQGYSVGSIFKIVGAISATEFGLEDRSYECQGSVEIGERQFPCWTLQKAMSGHGTLDLPGAIKNSCNCYFYQMGIELGSAHLFSTANLLGFNQKTGIELPDESSGIIPNEADYNLQYSGVSHWTDATMANTIIGQGATLATPLQMASLAATVGNGGTVWVPHLLQGTELERPNTHGLLTKEQLVPIRKGMWRAVNEAGGTGLRAKSETFETAGKTGTSQWRRKGIKDNKTWFMAFAPYEQPKYAICILVENGNSGGSCAAPIAKRILELVSKVDDTTPPPEPQPQPAIEGHFKFIEGVKFDP